MLKIIDQRLGVRIALIVNFFLFLVVAVGIGLFYRYQCGQLDNRLIQRGKELSMIGAESIAAILGEAVENGVFPIEDIFDMDYERIPDFDPPKYHTRYDAYMDKAVLKLQDEFLMNDSIIYAFALDANGYAPTHNARYQQPISGDPRKDREGNRSKRIFADAITANAAKRKEMGFVQIAPDADGQPVYDITSPIYIKGRYWGFFKIGLASAEVAAESAAMLRSLLLGGFVFLLFSATVIFLIVNRTLKPLSEFADRASALADGDVDRKIEFHRKDEIGRVADALERLRISLQAAIERLMRR